MKELQKKLLLLVRNEISFYDFSLKLSNQSYVKPFHGGKVTYHLTFINHEVDFDVTADVAIRFDALEDIVNEDNRFLTNKEKSLTYSFGVEMGNLVYGSQKRWTVYDESDVINVTKEIMNMFIIYAIPYFEKYCNIQNAFLLLADNKNTSWMHCPIHGERAKRALALSILLDNKERIPELVNESTKLLTQLNDFGLQDYLKFSRKLVTMGDRP